MCVLNCAVQAQSSPNIPEWAKFSAMKYPEKFYAQRTVPAPEKVNLYAAMMSYEAVDEIELVPPSSHAGIGSAIQVDSNGCESHQGGSTVPCAAWDSNLDFSPTPLPSESIEYDAAGAADNYDNKSCIPTQRPWLELGVPFYSTGILPPADPSLSSFNPIRQKFYLYGDFRAGMGGGRNAAGSLHNAAARLNLEADWQWTATGRFHGGFQPLNRGVEFTQVDFRPDGRRVIEQFNPNFVTGFFEGDLGTMFGTAVDSPAMFDMPISIGLLPLFYQNGIWMDDAVAGGAVALPFRHSNALNWANFDATFFVGLNQVNSPAFGTDNNDAHIFGTAWFIDAYDGYIEADWAYINDHADQGRSYHNIGLAFTRRYFNQISNSVRGIFNFGQDLLKDQRTADGALLLIENSLISPLPLQLVPYWNGFVGIDRPQSVARDVQAGGILRNTGINFETDGLNGYPTLDATANNTYGSAIGVNWLGLGLDRQIAVEAAYVRGYGDAAQSSINGDQFAIGSRLQLPVTNATLIRFDAMYGWRETEQDLWGARVEWRWKF